MQTHHVSPSERAAFVPRRDRTGVLLALVALSLAACSVAPPGQSPSPPGQRPPPGGSPAPGGSTPTPSDPLGKFSLDQVLANQFALDGRRILVRAGYYSRGGAEQFLVSGYLESYPPQPMLPLLLVGDVPQEVLARLETTAGKPGFALVVWGEVEAIGVFHAERGPAAAWFELESIRAIAGA